MAAEAAETLQRLDLDSSSLIVMLVDFSCESERGCGTVNWCVCRVVIRCEFDQNPFVTSFPSNAN